MKQEHIKKLKEQTRHAYGYSIHESDDYREPWRIFRIMAELVEGYQFLTQFKKEITIFGSARLSETSPYYAIARKLGELLGRAGFTVITGGGPGIMEAANRGTMEGGGISVGLNVHLPFEQVINPYVKKSTSFYYFFTRKVMLTSPANGFVFFPGGFGTLDEFFEVTDLMELGMMPKMPIVLVGSFFWKPLIAFLCSRSTEVGSIEETLVKRWHVVDTAEEAFEFLRDIEDKESPCELSPNSFHCQGNIDWKIFRVMAELVEGFDFLTGIKNGVTILGTKGVKKEHPYYHAAYTVGGMLAERGFAVITGGKLGIAEAANKGAFEHGGPSLGVAMRTSGKPDINAYLTKSIFFTFPFTRKLIVTSPTKAFIVFSGGFGTLHQLFEVLTLMQTGKMPRIPILLYDHAFWSPLHAYIKKVLVDEFETIAPEDDELYQIVDNEKYVVDILEELR